MTPAEQLRAEAAASEARVVDLGGPYDEPVGDARERREAWHAATSTVRLAWSLGARARLLDRCAESADRCGWSWDEHEDARADRVLGPIVAAYVEEERLRTLRVRAAWLAAEDVAARKLLQWKREARA